MSSASSPERVSAWRPSVPGVREVLHARFVDHAYPPHTHDAWTILLLDAGAVRYSLDRHDRGCVRSTVSVLPPHVVHDGRAATAGGFRKRVVYLDVDVLGEELIGPAVDRPVIDDPALVRRVGALHGALRHPDDALEAETRLSFVAEGLRQALLSGRPARAARPGLSDRADRTAWLGGADQAEFGSGPGATGSAAVWPQGGAAGASAELASCLRDLLDAHLFEPVTLAAAGARLGASPTHLVRCFTRTFGVPPHAYVLGRRIDAARRRLLDGQPPAEVAATVGFHDQSHLARHFRRHVGTTPGRYASH